MTVDELRRAFEAAATSSGTEARLVAASAEGGKAVLRARTAAPWTGRLAFEQALAGQLGEAAASVDLQWLAPAPASSSPQDRARARLGMAPKPSGPVEVAAHAPSSEERAAGKAPLKGGPEAVPGVRKVLAVASGKGGVGKSTVATNLALALQARGLRAGLLDADVYGPSAPTMLGSFAAPRKEGDRFLPPTALGLPFLSMGLMVNPDRSLIWRGPLVQRMVRDMLQSTAWPDLDVLVVDLPPGTGDVQLTLVQRALLDGAVVVTTPQDVALIDAARGLHMFETMEVRVLGIVENMASWACPACGEVAHPFGEGGGRREAEKRGVPFLGSIPLEGAVREGGDRGQPVVLEAPDSAAGRAFTALAESVAGSLGLQ